MRLLSTRAAHVPVLALSGDRRIRSAAGRHVLVPTCKPALIVVRESLRAEFWALPGCSGMCSPPVIASGKGATNNVDQR